MENNSPSKTSQKKEQHSGDAFTNYGKLPPQAIDLEEAILGAIMIEKDAILEIADMISPDHFYKDGNQKIYAAALRLFQRSKPIDILTITEELRRSGDLEAIGGAYHITQLTDRVASSANITYHARIVFQKYLQREMIRICVKTINEAYDDSTDVFELIDNHESEILKSQSNLDNTDIVDVADVLESELKEMNNPPIHGLLGIGSGFSELDRITNGWKKTDLMIIAARPAMGKTAFALNNARNAVVDFDKPGIIFSLEMSKEQLTQRLLASEAKILLDKIQKRHLEQWEWMQIHEALNKIGIGNRLFIDDTPSITLTQFRSKAIRAKKKYDIQWIIIDYLQLMKGEQSKNGNREQEISSISRGLKGVAKELGIPVIALSQLSRAVESRAGSKRPMLSDLRESGAIEQDADLVLFLYRPEYYGYSEDEEGMPTAGIAEVIVAKNRHGECDTVKLKFNGAVMLFKDLDLDNMNNFTTLNPSASSLNNNFIIRNMPYKEDDDGDEMPF